MEVGSLQRRVVKEEPSSGHFLPPLWKSCPYTPNMLDYFFFCLTHCVLLGDASELCSIIWVISLFYRSIYHLRDKEAYVTSMSREFSKGLWGGGGCRGIGLHPITSASASQCRSLQRALPCYLPPSHSFFYLFFLSLLPSLLYSLPFNLWQMTKYERNREV